MIINHNIAALNTHRQMGSANSAQMSSMEKLSSGLRINKASDDAAGLSISEKMRGQIRGLEQASSNAQDGISLMQTAEGALNETHDMLQRMRELSVQASNGTNTAEDKTAIQEELTKLTEEIDSISKNTKYNTQSLLDGSFASSFQVGANAGQQMSLSIGAMGSNSLGLSGGVELNTVTDTNVAKLSEGTYTVKGSDLINANDDVVGQITAAGVITLADSASSVIDLTHDITNGSTIKFEGTEATVTIAKGTGGDVSKLAAGEYSVSGTNLLNDNKLVGTISGTTLTLADGGGNVDLTQFGLVTTDVDATGDTFTVKGVDVSSEANASGSITTIDNAIKLVSEQRSKLGAMQNRLDHTINNLNTSAENLTSAESRIRDVDYTEAA